MTNPTPSNQPDPDNHTPATPEPATPESAPQDSAAQDLSGQPATPPAGEQFNPTAPIAGLNPQSAAPTWQEPQPRPGSATSPAAPSNPTQPSFGQPPAVQAGPVAQPPATPQPGYGAQPEYGVQPGYPQQPAQPPVAPAQQPSYDTQPGYGTQPGYPQQPAQQTPQPGYDTQPGYGTQPSYDAQPGYPQAPARQAPTQQPSYDTQPGYGTQPQAQPGYDTQPGYGTQPQAQPGYGTQPQAQPGYGTQPGYDAQPGYAPAPQSPAQPPASGHPTAGAAGHEMPPMPPGHHPPATPPPAANTTPAPVNNLSSIVALPGDWQRPSWKQLFTHTPALLTALVAMIIANATFDGLYPILVAFMVFGFNAISDIVRVLTSRYRLTDQLIEEKSQFLSTNHASTLISRIRTVSIEQSWIQRLLNTANIKITSGSDTDNVTITGTTLEQAEQLKHTLDTHPARTQSDNQKARNQQGQTLSASTKTAPQAQTATAASPQPFYQPKTLTELKTSWAWRSAVTGPGLFPLLAVFGFLQFVPGISSKALIERFTDYIATNESSWRNDAAEFSVAGLDANASWIVVGVILAAALAVLGYIANVARYVIKHHGFKLTQLNPTTLEKVEGFFSRKTISIDMDRMRGLSMQSGPIERLVRTARLEAILTEGTAEQLTSDNSLTPRIPRDEAMYVSDQLTGPAKLLSEPLTPHGPRAARRLFIGAVRATLIWAAIFWAATTYLEVTPLLWWVLLPLGLWSLTAAWLTYRALGYALPAGHVVLRSGFWAQEHKAVERRVALGIQFNQNFWQRQAGVTTLTLLDTASGHDLPDLTPEAAADVAFAVQPELLTEFMQTPPRRD